MSVLRFCFTRRESHHQSENSNCRNNLQFAFHGSTPSNFKGAEWRLDYFTLFKICAKRLASRAFDFEITKMLLLHVAFVFGRDPAKRPHQFLAVLQAVHLILKRSI